MREADLLKRAEIDFWTVEQLYRQEISDPFQLDIIAYHLQQTVEKLLKYELNFRGIEFRWTHIIEELCEQMEEHDLMPPEWIIESAELLTDYAVKTRYLKTLVASRRKLDELIPKCREYLQILQERQRP